MEARRRKRHRRDRSLSNATILLFVGLAEISIYYLYSWADYYSYTSSAGSFADRIFNEFLVGNEQPSANDYRATTEDPAIDMEATLKRTSKAFGYADHPFDPLHIPPRDDTAFYRYASKEEMGANYTIQVLQSMGVNHSELVERGLLKEIPPWWQILDNYGNEPIILGLERCEKFRERVHRRHVGPAGLFSTGTNLLQQLLFDNCIPAPPLKRRPRQFNLYQAPWGKHNPASARLFHIAKNQEARNQSATLPVVAVRHPYTWLYALCKSPYSLAWMHQQEFCDRSLNLQVPVQANFGALRLRPTKNGSTATTTATPRSGRNMTYESLIHVWREWNLEYFQQVEFPMLMVRFEDLVFRPKQVIEQVCHCAGGKVKERPFWYLTDSANLGPGHGMQRSDLVSAVIRYGQPLDLYRRMYSPSDWTVIRKVLEEDQGLTKALGYKV